MEVLTGTHALAHDRRLRAPVVAIGNFDGVHVGHQRLLGLARDRARALGGEAVALTFAPHPARVLAPALAPPLLTTEARKEELIAAQGIDLLVNEPFTPALAALEPDAFIAEILLGRLGAREVIVGYDFSYGKERRGTPATLQAEGAAHGFAVHIVPQVTVHGLVASSTKVREFLLEGNLAGARQLLGRDFDVDGRVVRGHQRGTQLGIPTANIAIEGEFLPRAGIYAVRYHSDGGPPLPGAASVGTNPTFGPGAPISLEVHILDFAGDLYDHRARVAFHTWLRAEERFASVDALVAQIRRDIDRARTALSEVTP